MDIERRMEFIVETLADVVARQQKAEIRAARTDRQIHGLQTIVKTGMKMLIKLEKGHKKLQQDLTGLTTQLKRTDQKFERWLDSMNKGQNGHKKRPN